MASLPIRWIEARAFCQATEDEDRVRNALDSALPGAGERRSALEGQFGNPIVLIVRKIEHSEAIRGAWERWRRAGLIRALQGDAESRVDDNGVLHFRLDKQAALQGRLVPAQTADAIDTHVKLKAYHAKREEILRVAHGLLAEAV